MYLVITAVNEDPYCAYKDYLYRCILIVGLWQDRGHAPLFLYGVGKIRIFTRFTTRRHDQYPPDTVWYLDIRIGNAHLFRAIDQKKWGENSICIIIGLVFVLTLNVMELIKRRWFSGQKINIKIHRPSKFPHQQG